MDSAKNWILTCPGRAPMAMRMPISRVRSVTETSMMFMMPMPPTRRETAAMLASRLVITRLVDSAASANSLRFRTRKSSACPALRSCRWRRSALICSWAAKLARALTAEMRPDWT